MAGKITEQELHDQLRQKIDDATTHLADNTKHVTQSEKDAWNATQAKANDFEILYWMGAI